MDGRQRKIHSFLNHTRNSVTVEFRDNDCRPVLGIECVTNRSCDQKFEVRRSLSRPPEDFVSNEGRKGRKSNFPSL